MAAVIVANHTHRIDIINHVLMAVSWLCTYFVDDQSASATALEYIDHRL